MREMRIKEKNMKIKPQKLSFLIAKRTATKNSIMVLLHIFCNLVILLQIISRHQQIKNYGIHARYVAIERFTRLHKICAYSFFEFELSLIRDLIRR